MYNYLSPQSIIIWIIVLFGFTAFVATSVERESTQTNNCSQLNGVEVRGVWQEKVCISKDAILNEKH